MKSTYSQFLLLFVFVVLLFTLSGCSYKTDNADNNSNLENNEEMSIKDNVQKWDSEPEMQINTASQYVATIKTNLGDIKVNLFTENAPRTVNNFVFLANNNFYDGVIFHRVIKGFMIQGGDPTGTGTSDAGYKFADEINAVSLGLADTKLIDAPFLAGMIAPEELDEYGDKSVKEIYEMTGYEYIDSVESKKMNKGVIAMANAGPNTNGSQFFIVSDKPQPHLDGKHTVFGEVVEGMDVVMKIESVPTDRQSKPLDDVVIGTVEIEEQVAE